VGVKLPGVKHSSADEVIDKNTILVHESDGEVVSDTGEMYRSWKKGFGYIDSPRTKAAYGFLRDNGQVKLSGVEIKCENEFATVVLSSLSDSPICSSKNILLTTVGRVENKGMLFNETRDELLGYGTAPIMVEVIKATISILTPIDNLKIWAVGAEGFLTGMIPAKYENGTLTFTTGETWPSIYYLIQAD
ncbi:MAG TPA: hypothetical protein PLZ84_08585, partial [Clostridia bacterium]|nr:hypothetical protein [Clostridia bacterium]